MGRAKLPRKSTSIDMTAMCDVAFLLLSFFILATKQKPPEVVPVATPSSVSTIKVAEDKTMVTVSKSGKVYLSFDDKEKQAAVIEDLNKRLALGLSSAELAKAKSAPLFGTPFSSLKSYLDRLPESAANADALPGIPAQDSTNNQLKDWMESVSIAFTGAAPNLTVKGDNVAGYPVIKGVLYAFKQNDLLKFNIITGSEGLDPSTDLYKETAAKKPK
jgi:biopolymer transport protein ExbD